MSPAAKMSGSELRSWSSTRTPLSVRRPAAWARVVSGVTPIPTTSRSASIDEPSAKCHDRQSAVCLDGRDLGVGAQVDAVCLVEGREGAGDLRSQDAEQGQVQGFQDGDVGTRAAGRRGYLQADPSAADDHQSTPDMQPGPDQVGVLDGAQVGDGRAAVVGHRQVARSRPGDQQQLVVALGGAAGGHRAGGRVDGGDPGTQSKVDVVRVVPLGRLNEGGLEAVVAHQVSLGERRPLVGQVGFGAVEHEVSVEAALPQLLHGLAGSQAPAGDHEGLCGGHGQRPRRGQSVMPSDPIG